MKKKITYVLIADGARAKLLIKNKDGLTRILPTHHLEEDVDVHQDKGASTPGKTSFAVNHGLHSYPTHSDWYKFKKEVFATEIAAILYQAEKDYDSLILIASPFVLGCLRQHLSQAVTDKIKCEINEDLTKLPLKKVFKMITDRIVV